ncbi:MAG: hypothetical protein ACRCYC_10335 [Paraclostridium sp.]|uniref:hypothetical protein n=1 Tax=Paraclostridium sp. TaxID=2023273 RepID=UPI003F33437B
MFNNFVEFIGLQPLLSKYSKENFYTVILEDTISNISDSDNIDLNKIYISLEKEIESVYNSNNIFLMLKILLNIEYIDHNDNGILLGQEFVRYKSLLFPKNTSNNSTYIFINEIKTSIVETNIYLYIEFRIFSEI